MANLKHTELFDFDHHDMNIQGKPVGNNRTVSHFQTSYIRTIAGHLHGHTVFRVDMYNGKLTVQFDNCGYTTKTTCEAINDFAGAMGLPFRACRQKGKFGIWSYKDRVYYWAKDDRRVTLRYDDIKDVVTTPANDSLPEAA